MAIDDLPVTHAAVLDAAVIRVPMLWDDPNDALAATLSVRLRNRDRTAPKETIAC